MSSVYRNGNYIVLITENTVRKRSLRKNEEFIPEFPDSIDLKISNRCSVGCQYCHESSLKSGELADLDKLFTHLSVLPEVPIEIAIGGGDLLTDDESIDHLVKVVDWCKRRGHLPRVTVNEASITKKNIDYLHQLSLPIGLSLRPSTTEKRFMEIADLIQDYYHLWSCVVFHIIVGAIDLELLDKLCNWDNNENLLLGQKRLLFLGFKDFGRAHENNIKPVDIDKFERIVKKAILNQRLYYKRDFWNTNNVFGFDNLAIEQLNIEASLLDSEYEDIFLGNEFSCSMYVDGVKGEYAKTSRDPNRVSWNDIGLIDFFKHDKIKK